MQVLIAEPDLRLRSEMFTALNDAGFWLLGLPPDGGTHGLPRVVRRAPCALVAECGTPGNLVAALRARWPRIGVIYTAAPGAPTPALQERDGVLSRPVVMDELVRRLRAFA